jgi:hypothetical protein
MADVASPALALGDVRLEGRATYRQRRPDRGERFFGAGFGWSASGPTSSRRCVAAARACVT